MAREKDGAIMGAIITRALKNTFKNTPLTCPYCHSYFRPTTTVTRCQKCGRQITIKICEGG